ncbi:MAG: phosphatidylserine decarboxylase [Candidatus Omnitrophica bacterium]|nr:phosphatidylserine decarboxylase [Candidatus Omnitrophota bacterium]
MKIRLDQRVWFGAVVCLIGLIVARLIFDSPRIIPIGLILLAGHLIFFRDPVRKPLGAAGPLSPADGKIVEISSCYEERFLKANAVKIGIFLSIFDAHVTFAPQAGIIGYLQYEPGKFLNAIDRKSVNFNESNWIGIDGSEKVLVRQIAGTIARRIFWDVGLQDKIERGTKLGIICYGSRVECYLPSDRFQPSVQRGEKVKAGETILGVWKL